MENRIMSDTVHRHPGTSRQAPKPSCTTNLSPNRSSRNGVPIKRVVLHYTTSRSLEGAISWFLNPKSQVSAHYIVSREGKLVQMVPDEQKAWHAAAANTDSIGIEFCAAPGDKLAPEQDKTGRALIRYLAEEYHLTADKFSGHRFLPSTTTGTACPGNLWTTLAELQNWVKSAITNSPLSDVVSKPKPYKPCPIPMPHPGVYLLGSMGDAVYELQCALIGLGYLKGPAKPETMVGNLFDKTVENAVKRFQTDNQLSVDGVVGPHTRIALVEVLSKVRGAFARLASWEQG